MKTVEENKKDKGGGEQLPRQAALKTTPSCDLSESTPGPLQHCELLLLLSAISNAAFWEKETCLPSPRGDPALNTFPHRYRLKDKMDNWETIANLY